MPLQFKLPQLPISLYLLSSTFATLRTFRFYLKGFLQVASFLLIPAIAFGQQAVADSLRAKLQKDSAYIYRFKKVHFLFSIDQRSTFVATPKNNYASFDVFGIKAGLILNERHKAGLGLYSLRNAKTKINNGSQPDETIKFSYLSLFYEYYFVSNRWVDIGFPLEAGIGRYRITPIKPAPDPTTANRLTVIPTGISLDVHFKPIRWISLYGMGGYRYVLNPSSSVDLSNWFYAFGVSISLRHISEDTRYYLKKRKYRNEIARLDTGQIE